MYQLVHTPLAVTPTQCDTIHKHYEHVCKAVQVSGQVPAILHFFWPAGGVQSINHYI